MAIAGGKRASRSILRNDDNPREPDIEQGWAELQPALAAYEGRRAQDILERLRERDRPVWNAVHWRTVDWLESWFRGRGLGRDGQFPDDDFAGAALVNFLNLIFPNDRDAATVESFKLPRILQELRALGARVHEDRVATVPAPRPATVHSRIAAVVPGALFDDGPAAG